MGCEACSVQSSAVGEHIPIEFDYAQENVVVESVDSRR